MTDDGLALVICFKHMMTRLHLHTKQSGCSAGKKNSMILDPGGQDCRGTVKTDFCTTGSTEKYFNTSVKFLQLLVRENELEIHL